MLMHLPLLMLLGACSMGALTDGGQRPHAYDPREEARIEDLRRLAPEVVELQTREPPAGKRAELFSPTLPAIRRVGIVIFEANVQGTRSGLAGEGVIYPTLPGKQLITEKLLSVWENALPLAAPEIEYVPVQTITASPTYQGYGMEVENHVGGERKAIESDDIGYLEKGRKTPTAIYILPRHMRDLSLLLVPASELMGGPKWSEHQKHFLAEVMREHRLDAALVIMSELEWQRAHRTKVTEKELPQALRLRLKTSSLISFTDYHQRLEQLGRRERPGVSVPQATVVADVSLPIEIDLPPEEQSFAAIEERLLNPLFKTYRDLVLMSAERLRQEWLKTQ